MRILVIAEHNNQIYHPATLHTIAASLECGAKPVVLVAGFECYSIAEQLAQVSGVETVFYADDQSYEALLAENVSRLAAEVGLNFDMIMMSSSSFGKNILPRVSALLDVGMVSDVTRIITSDTFLHPIYAGNALETVRILDAKKVISIRTTAFEAVETKQDACKIERLSQSFVNNRVAFIDYRLSNSPRPELTQAKIVVAGGRGLQSKENFALIETLADELGAAVGASRAAVDAGFVPNDYQVGQTGKVVAPLLYIAIGISGAVQHLAGMKDSKIIVAINKDENAPIMQVADYKLVGDLFEIVPEMIQQLKGVK